MIRYVIPLAEDHLAPPTLPLVSDLPRTQPLRLIKTKLSRTRRGSALVKVNTITHVTHMRLHTHPHLSTKAEARTTNRFGFQSWEGWVNTIHRVMNSKREMINGFLTALVNNGLHWLINCGCRESEAKARHVYSFLNSNRDPFPELRFIWPVRCSNKWMHYESMRADEAMHRVECCGNFVSW